MVEFRRATREQLKARVALLGPAGSGKSYTALRLAFLLGNKVAAIDTEHGSLSKYVGESPDGTPWQFDVIEPDSFAPEVYIAGIKAAEQAGYDVLIIDSLSHAWAGKGGILEFVDETTRKQSARGSANSFSAWREATPKHNELVEAMLAARLHLIVTMRVKTDYVQEKDERTGKTVISKKGLQPVQRDGLEYEFDVIGDLTDQNAMLVSKSRCSALQGQMYTKPGPEVADILRLWLNTGERPAEKPVEIKPAKPVDNGPAETSGDGPYAKEWQSARKWVESELTKLNLTIEQARDDMAALRYGPEEAVYY
jgi:hypothetical protein